MVLLKGDWQIPAKWVARVLLRYIWFWICQSRLSTTDIPKEPISFDHFFYILETGKEPKSINLREEGVIANIANDGCFLQYAFI